MGRPLPAATATPLPALSLDTDAVTLTHDTAHIFANLKIHDLTPKSSPNFPVVLGFLGTYDFFKLWEEGLSYFTCVFYVVRCPEKKVPYSSRMVPK